jgi:hypothetical protein
VTEQELPRSEWVSGLAKRIITQHHEPPNPHQATGSCGKCRDDGCEMLEWARDALGRYRFTANQPGRFAGRARI